MHAEFFEPWDDWVRRMNANTRASFRVFFVVVRIYSLPPRAYHNINHIGSCLERFRMLKPLCRGPELVEGAIWFHDLVYDSRRQDNEERSAERARFFLGELGVADDEIQRIERLILLTKHNAEPADADGSVLLDVDLSILGAPREEFDDYERAIRQEYAWVDEEAFRTGRAKVLRSFLDRPRIYRTDEFFDLYEARARANLEDSLARLA